jgi:NADH-quinone oxidoreductase subunit G
VGYGGSASRYQEEKRVVFHKNVGPLISMEEMSRCIHCTRCVRFGQEIAGTMELGMAHRGEHSEITTFVGRTVDSELSGNMIDICPVGALTSKPFRYSARTWELARRRSVSPHDSTGANLVVQVKADQVMRVVPLENEAVNECWLADRDRFSYEALSSPQRLTRPMLRQGGQWVPTDWQTALEFVAGEIKRIVAAHGADALGALGSPHATVEELYLLGQLARGLGSPHVDHRLRHADFRRTGAPEGGARWLGLPVASLSSLDRALLVGSFLRKDHPLFAQRLRQATRRGAQVSSLQAAHDDWLMPLHARLTAAPSQWPAALAEVAAAVAREAGVAAPVPVEPSQPAQAVARSLLSGERKAVLLGHAAVQHPQAAELLALANWIGTRTGAAVGVLGEAANSVGAQLAGALPGPGGLDAAGMLAQPRRALLLLGVEPVLDMADPQAAHAALQQGELVVAFTSFLDAAVQGAHVLLPIAPYTETSGTFVNAEGRAQGFAGVVRPLGETRPAWKVLRVLGNLLGLPGFDFESAEQVRAAALGDESRIAERLSNEAGPVPAELPAAAPSGCQRLADVPIYSADALVRRAPSLQATADARPPQASVGTALWAALGLQPGDRLRVRQGTGSVELPARLDATMAEDTVRVPAGHADTCALGAATGRVELERVPQAQGVGA